MSGVASIAHNVAAQLARTAAAWPRLPALASGGSVVADYATLARRVAQLAAGLRAEGLQPGDRVAIVARNVAPYVEALFACWWAGLVAVPVNAKLHPRELASCSTIRCAPGVRGRRVEATLRRPTPAACGVVELGGRDYARSSRPQARRCTRSRPTMRRGSSTRAARPAGRRAW